MPKIDKDLQARMEELGMEFVPNPPPPVFQVPKFEKVFEVVIDPSMDTEQFRERGIKSRGYKEAYLSGGTLRMSQETAEYVDENQALYNLRIIRESK